MRPMTMRLLPAVVVLLIAAACGAADESSVSSDGPAKAPSSPAEPSSVEVPPDGRAVSVVLWHCGVEPVTVDGRVWEVPLTETVDGDSNASLDSTNTPSDWVGRGNVGVAEDEMTYTDEGGAVVRFVPGDDQPPAACD